MYMYSDIITYSVPQISVKHQSINQFSVHHGYFYFEHFFDNQTNIRLRLWYITPLSTIIQLYHSGQFYYLRKPVYPYKTTELSQVTDKLSKYRMYVLLDHHLMK